jgi:hypothetical protein
MPSQGYVHMQTELLGIMGVGFNVWGQLLNRVFGSSDTWVWGEGEYSGTVRQVLTYT